MKIKCINDRRYLTIGKIYDVIKEDRDDGDYLIIDNDGGEWWYEKKLFKTLAEIRNDKIDKLLEDES